MTSIYQLSLLTNPSIVVVQHSIAINNIRQELAAVLVLSVGTWCNQFLFDRAYAHHVLDLFRILFSQMGICSLTADKNAHLFFSMREECYYLN